LNGLVVCEGSAHTFCAANGRERERERERERVCVCVCERERERERESVCERERERPCVQPLRDDLVMLAAQANCTWVDHQFDHQCWLRSRTADKPHIKRTPRLLPKPSSEPPFVSKQPVIPAGKAHPASRRCASPSQLLGCKGGEKWLQGHLGSRRCGAGTPAPSSPALS